MTEINNGQKVLKVDVLTEKVLALEKHCKELDDELNIANLQIARLSEKVAFFQIAQGSFTVIASAIATAIAVMLGG